jgi:uncharacterized protein (UPF0333 family)
MKAQIAVEYIIIVSLVIAFLIPVWGYIGGVKRQANTQLMFSYAQNAVDRIVDTAELVYSQGPPAKLRIKVYIPQGVENINVTGYMARMGISLEGQYSDVMAASSAPMNGTLPTIEGSYWVSIEAADNHVEISYL